MKDLIFQKAFSILEDRNFAIRNETKSGFDAQFTVTSADCPKRMKEMGVWLNW